MTFCVEGGDGLDGILGDLVRIAVTGDDTCALLAFPRVRDGEATAGVLDGLQRWGSSAPNMLGFLCKFIGIGRTALSFFSADLGLGLFEVPSKQATMPLDLLLILRGVLSLAGGKGALSIKGEGALLMPEGDDAGGVAITGLSLDAGDPALVLGFLACRVRILSSSSEER